MRLFLLFAPAFLEWPLAISRRLAELEPDSAFSGLVTGQEHIYKRVRQSDVALEPLDRLDDLERTWLETPVDQNDMKRFEERLSTEAIRRLIVADRQIGRGYVTGGMVAPTPIMQATRDPELLERYVIGLLNYTFRVLQQFKPDLVFCYTVAGAPAYALGVTCQALNIPFTQFNHARIGKRLVLDDSIFDVMTPVSRLFKENLRNPDREPRFRRQATLYLKEFREKAEAPEYLAHHLKSMRDRQKLSRLLRLGLGAARATVRSWRRRRDLRRPEPMVQLKYDLAAALRARRLTRSGLFLEPGARPTRPYIFMPLHFDPEASTMVVSAMHTNQLAIIEAISKSLPLGMTLLVKEHSPMLGWRPRDFYKQLLALPGVVLASPVDSGARLARDSAITAVINSTSALEAIIFGKPAVIVGQPHFKMLESGLVHCPDLARLPKAIEKARDLAPIPEDHLVSFVAAMLESSFDCPIEVIWGKVTRKTVENNQQVLKSIVERLQAVSNQDAARSKETA